MSILIKDMEMPRNCAECPVNMNICKRGYKYLLEHPELYDRRADDCPIIGVPPHGRLIDADELMRRIQLYIDEYELYVDENGFHCEKWCAMKETEMAINDAPTIVSADKDGET